MKKCGDVVLLNFCGVAVFETPQCPPPFAKFSKLKMVKINNG